MQKRALFELGSLCVVFMSSAYAAVVVTTPAESSTAAALKYVWVVLMATVGWAAAALPDLAEWRQGNAKSRLLILSIYLRAIVFGFVGFSASVGLNQNIMICYIAAASGAYEATKRISAKKEETPEGAK